MNDNSHGLQTNEQIDSNHNGKTVAADQNGVDQSDIDQLGVGQSNTDHMSKLDPSYIMVMRLTAFIWACILGGAIFIGDAALAAAGHIQIFIIAAPISLILLIMVYIVPPRRYKRWGYDMNDKQIQIIRGYLFFTDTIVPFSRVQHIDIAQGPILRLFGLSQLILHTAGTHNSTVILPGLKREIAEGMRDTIRHHIKADML